MILCETLLHLLPGDAATRALMHTPKAISATGAAELRHAWGQDLSLVQRLAERFSGLMGGDLGTSLMSERTVASALAEAMAGTAPLMLLSLMLGLPGGFAIGMWTASGESRRRRWTRTLTALWLASPVFALAVAHQRIAEQLGHPTAGASSVGWAADEATWRLWVDHARHMLLPLWVLASVHGALAAQYTHRLAVAARTAPEVRLAFARGLPSTLVRRAYLAPLVLTRLAPLLSARMTTVVASNLVVEILFEWPGLGSLLWQSMDRRDAPMLTGGMVLVGAAVYLANRGADAMSLRLDPVRHQREAA